MSTSSRFARLPRFSGAAAVLVGFFAVACGATEPTTPDLSVVGPSGDSITTPASGAKADSGSATPPGDVADSCTREYLAADTSTLTACGDGQGHCYDKDKTPSVGTLTECSATQWCVPDAVLAADGNALKSCTSGYGPGACVGTLVKEVADNVANLSHDGCDDTTYCVPCVHPTTHVANPACSAIGVYDKACAGQDDDAGSEPVIVADAGPIELASCCSHDFSAFGGGISTAGTCVPNAALTPQEQSAGFPTDTCTENFSCAPNELYNEGQGGGVFKGCYWEGDWFSDGQGVCVDSCFLTGDQIYQLDDNGVESNDCSGTQRCVPCESAPAGTPGCY